jgi:D-hydroxyproline dehydrogenase subunit gamma
MSVCLESVMRAEDARSRQNPCTVRVDDTELEALDGQTVAAVLVGAGIWRFGTNPVTADPRGPYCGMGICFECELEIDGMKDTRACVTYIRDGMVIRTRTGEVSESRDAN